MSSRPQRVVIKEREVVESLREWSWIAYRLDLESEFQLAGRYHQDEADGIIALYKRTGKIISPISYVDVANESLVRPLSFIEPLIVEILGHNRYFSRDYGDEGHHIWLKDGEEEVT